jgi:hypothetical protein
VLAAAAAVVVVDLVVVANTSRNEDSDSEDPGISKYKTGRYAETF